MQGRDHDRLRTREPAASEVAVVGPGRGGLVADLAIDDPRDDRCDAIEVEGFGSGQDRCCAIEASIADEREPRDRGEIGCVDERCSAAPGRDMDAVVVDDVEPVAVEQVLGEEARAQEGPRAHAAGLDVCLDLGVGDEPGTIGADDRQEHDALDTRAHGRVDTGVEGGADVADGRWSQEEQRVDVDHGRTESRCIAEVELDRLDAVVHGLVRASTDADSDRVAVLAQQFDERGADVARRSRDQDALTLGHRRMLAQIGRTCRVSRQRRATAVISSVAMTELADPTTVAAIARARRAHAAATGRWVSYDEEDPACEAEQLARDALAHLDAGRWDDAQGCADAAVSLAEEHGQTEVWREFALLVEEAAETGRDGQELGPDLLDAELDEDDD